MNKYHKFISLAVGLLFAAILQVFSTPQPVFRILAPAFLAFCAAATYYNKRYLESLGKNNFWVLLRPVLLFLSGFGDFFLLPSGGFRAAFLISAVAVIFLVELALGNFSENLLINETLVIGFGFFTALTAFNQYFINGGGFTVFGRPLFGNLHFGLQSFYLGLTFLSVLLLSRSFYEFLPQPPRVKWASAASLGLFCAEMFWALSFLPFHYSAQAVILFCVFYFCLILNYFHLFNALTLKKAQFHLFLIILACGIAVLATPWKILN
jgi:hypothetical protein